MAIDIKFDLVGNPEPPTIILANRNGNILGQLDVDVNSINMSDRFNDASEFSFTMYKNNIDLTGEELILYRQFLKSTNNYILKDSDGLFLITKNSNEYILSKELFEYYLWEKTVDFKLVYCKEWDEWFEIKVELDEATETIKTVFCTQLGKAELSQLNLYNIEINTEKDIERDNYKISILYNKDDEDASILNRCLKDKAPHYSIIHVDSTIANIQRSFSFNDTSIDDAFQEIAEEIGCLFVYHSYKDKSGKLQRTISVYDLYQNCNNCGHRGEYTDVCPKCGNDNIKYGYGEDTLIFITSDELASDGIELVTDTDSVKNCFKLEAGDDLMTATVRNCNPNGTDYIWYFSDSMKEDMSEELVEKLESYNELYQQYYNEHVSNVDEDLLQNYNTLVDKYSIYNEDLKKIATPIVGYPSLMTAYYNTIDLELYLKSGLMPSVQMNGTTAEEQASLLTSTSLSTVAVANIDTVSLATANSAVLAMAKIIVKSTYKVEVNTSSLSNDKKTWTGNFVITNYSDEEDVATSNTISVVISGNTEEFIKQKIEKALNKENTDDLSVAGLFEKDYDEFCAELKKYALNPLNNFHESCQICIDILTEQGVGNSNTWSDNESGSDGNLYEKLYVPYYNKLMAIESEMKIREDEINIISGVYDVDGKLTSDGLQINIEKCQLGIKGALNFEKYLGEYLWLEFCAYRREDTYSNDNYVSDGLDNVELFKRALEFYEVAENEIYKSAELQHSISTTLNNLLAIPKFKSLVKYFKVGNWIRVQVDNKIFKLRLLEYEIDFGNFENISVEFSDVTKIKNGITDVQSVIEQSKSMASSYSSMQRQASQGNQAKVTINQWISDGLDTSLVKIQNNNNEDFVINKNGLLGRSYDDITGSYSPKQIKITHNMLAYTDNTWESVRLAIGEYDYYTYDEVSNTFVNKVGYGINADAVTAGVVIGSQIIGGDIYSDNYSVTNGTGSYLNLRDGTFSFAGGSLRYEGGKLLISSPDVPTSETITEINEQYLKTTSVYAQNLQVNSAKINGKLTASQINTTGLIAENISGTTITGKTIDGGYLLIGNKSGTYAEITSGGVLNCHGANINGIINSDSGNIGGWELSSNGFSAIVTKTYDEMTSNDLSTAQQLANNSINYTDEYLKKYDFDKDGIINAKDLLKISKLTGDLYDTYKDCIGTILIDPTSFTDTILLKSDSGLFGALKTRIGIGSIETGSIKCSTLNSTSLFFNNISHFNPSTGKQTVGISGSFATSDGKIVTITSGIITSISQQ